MDLVVQTQVVLKRHLKTQEDEIKARLHREKRRKNVKSHLPSFPPKNIPFKKSICCDFRIPLLPLSAYATLTGS